MKLKFIKKEIQEFDLNRVNNISLCNCENCDYMNCPKDNYSLELTRYIYTVDEFIEENREELFNNGFTENLVNDFFESCIKYPSDFYYSFNNNSQEVYIVKLNKKSETKKAIIYIDGSSLVNLSLSKDNYKWALKILEQLREINKYIEDYS